VRAGAFEENFAPSEAQLNLMKYINIHLKQPSGIKKYSLLKTTAKCHMA
jgi:hypothetical protein